MTSDELIRETKRLEESLKNKKSQINFISDAIRKMEMHYEESRSLNPFLRYQALKKIIKSVTKSSLIRDN